MNKQTIDQFYQTEYTFSLASEICTFYNENYYSFICLNCKNKPVDIKKDVIDHKQPLFGIFRKKYCLGCWLKMYRYKHPEIYN